MTVRQRLILACFACGLAALAEGAPDVTESPRPAPDERAVASLMASGLAYEVDEDGDFRLLYELADGRSQVAWVASVTTRLQTVEFRDVWSVAHRASGPVPANLAGELLADNAARTAGAWQVQRSGDEYVVVYSAQVAADASPALLTEVLDAVIKAADEMERRLGGSDQF